MEKIIKELKRLLIKSAKINDTPVAAIIVENDKIIARGYNKRNKSNLTIDHAEIIALLKANKKIKNWRANKCTMYVTLEPCEMCKSILKESRINKVIYLLPRDDRKKQYNKTEFIEWDDSDALDFKKEYQTIMRKFWENKR